MTRRRARHAAAPAFLAAWLGAGDVGAETAAFVAPEDARLEVTTEIGAPEPYAHEMVLVRIRGTYTVQMTLETLEQPDLSDFAWMQLGRDRWTATMVDGRAARAYERVMALFPRRPGRLVIEPFVHRLTLLGPGGERVRHDVVSAPVAVAARAEPAAGWWLPARALRLTDAFDRDPAALAPGETARRTVTIEAEGVPPDRLPPMPSLRAPGVVAFADPEERSGRLTPEGPVATVVWRWTVRPVNAEPSALPAVTIPWFDTVARRTEQVRLAERRVARLGAAAAAEEPPALVRHRTLAVALAGALGLGLGLAALGAGGRPNAARLAHAFAALHPDPDRRAMRRAVRTRDPALLRAAALRRMARLGIVPDARSRAVLDHLGMLAYAPRPEGATAGAAPRRVLVTARRTLLRRRRTPPRAPERAGPD